jgi:Tfp pilus assembly protein PilO
VKKKLKGLDPRIQIGLAVVAVLLFAVAGYMFVVSPQNAQAAKLRTQVSAEQVQVEQRRAAAAAGLHPPTIETADLFRLARAMPDRTDMPGIILTLSQVAASSGIKFDLIEPSTGATTAPLSDFFTTDRIHLQFHGDFYGLSDFLYRLRSLVQVRNGQLIATGRLFNVDTVTFNVSGNTFPQISADLDVDAYVYTSTATSTPAPSTSAAPSTETTPSTESSLPNDASATGATP